MTPEDHGAGNSGPSVVGVAGAGTRGAAASISVVLATPGPLAALATTIECLARQTIRDRIELVLVAPSIRASDLDGDPCARLGAVVAVQAGPVVSIGHANALGVRAASAPVVAFGEDHAFPEPDWAERLVAAHAGDWVAVGPAVTNANPVTAVSRADWMIGYGPWLAPAASRDADFLPGHNSSYRREALAALGDELDAWLESETLLHWELRARGHRLRLEAGARIAHVNFSRWRSWLAVQFHAGRSFAGARSRRMSLPRRVVYVAGSPLIPWVRLARIVGHARRGPGVGIVVTSLHALVVGLLADAAGQAVGYAQGPGNAAAAVGRYEFHRHRHLSARDLGDPRLARYATVSAG